MILFSSLVIIFSAFIAIFIVLVILSIIFDKSVALLFYNSEASLGFLFMLGVSYILSGAFLPEYSFLNEIYLQAFKFSFFYIAIPLGIILGFMRINAEMKSKKNSRK